MHLTLTFGKPLLDDVPSLVEGNGQFHKAAFYRQEDFSIDQEELYREWDAQIQKVYAVGIEPTHLDSHHYMHSVGRNQEVVVKLAKKYNLPVRRNFDMNNQVKKTDYFEGKFDLIGYPEKENVERYLEEVLQKLKTYETSEVMCHVGYIDKYLVEGSSFTLPRLYQTDFMIHSPFAKAIQEDKDIQLVHYGDIDF